MNSKRCLRVELLVPSGGIYNNNPMNHKESKTLKNSDKARNNIRMTDLIKRELRRCEG